MTDTDRRSDVDLASIPTLDLTTMTLGEMSEIELESGRSFPDLLRAGSATKRLLALWQQERRSVSSEKRRSWRELADLHPRASSSSPSPSGQDGVPETSAR